VGGNSAVGEAEVEKGAVGEVKDEAAECSKVGDEAAASSKAGDEVAACSEAGIEDCRQRWHDDVCCNRTMSVLGGLKKLLSIARESAGTKILGHGYLMRDAPVSILTS
jgi:hypothetical protein